MTKELMSKLILRAQLGIETEMRALVSDAVNAWRMADEGEGKGCTKYSIAVTFTDDGNGAVKCKVSASVSTRVKSESETRIEDGDQMHFDGMAAPEAGGEKVAVAAEVPALPGGPRPVLAEKAEPHPDDEPTGRMEGTAAA